MNWTKGGDIGGRWHTATYSPGSLTITNWNQFAAVYNGSTIQLYLNGSAVRTAANQTGNLGSAKLLSDDCRHPRRSAGETHDRLLFG